MTYRATESMRGMGEWSAVLGATCPNLPTGGCLDATTLGMVAAAKFGLPGPAGMTPDTWAKMVTIVKSCQSPSWQSAPLCFSVIASLFTSVSKGGLMPDCLDANSIAFMMYAGRYPGANGPDPAMNALVWVSQKAHSGVYGTYLAALRKKPLCSASTPAPSTSTDTADAAAHAAAATAAAQAAADAAAAGSKAAADAAAAESAAHAQAAADAAAAAGTPDAASHAQAASDAANAAASTAGSATDHGPTAPVHHAGMTTGKWVAVGAVGLAAVVGVSIFLKKR